ncbi:putative Fe2+ transport system protein B [Desulfosarcina cetonica]|nr:putative Fe2+ transport system protein B [Desulfosarcina cetonica]
MLKIILPVSFATFLLDASGWLQRADGLLEPLMGLLHLPAMAALPLIAGMLTGIYGAIAAMSVLPFTIDQMTLMAVFLLIAHNLIQEGLVQHHSGGRAWTATFVRLSAAVVTVAAVGWFLGGETAQPASHAGIAGPMAFWPALKGWSMDMAWLSLKIFAIITGLMMLMEILYTFHLIDRLLKVIRPCMGLLGLDREVGMLWLTAVVFGIAYGSAVIVETVNQHPIAPEKLKTLHVSIGINHAVVEDPALFLPLGIHAFWLWIPRLVAAVLFAYTCRWWFWLRRRRRPLTAQILPANGRWR